MKSHKDRTFSCRSGQIQQKRVQSDAVITLYVERPVYGGTALAHHNGKICFVQGAIPGEVVEARITGEKSDYLCASTVTVLKPSADRIAPHCQVYGVCGGCQQQHISYARQVALKEEILADTLRRIGYLEPVLSAPLVDYNPWAYRHRAQMKGDGEHVGFYQASSRTVVDIDFCPVLTDDISYVFTKIRSFLSHNRGLSEALSGIHLVGNNYMVAGSCYLRKGIDVPIYELEAVVDQIGLQGLAVYPSRQSSPQKIGNPLIVFDLLGMSYTVMAGSFFQGHWRLNQQVVAFVRDILQPLDGKSILDLYAGSGNFSLPLAAEGAAVIAVEEDRGAIAAGIANAADNHIDDIRFIQSPVEWYQPDTAVDVIILDPPRPGLPQRVIETVLRTSADKIVYISCNPTTLARDLRKLTAMYTLNEVRLIDFFPQTYHLEAMAVLDKRHN